MIFVDTGAWFAAVVTAAVNHAAAKHWLDQNTESLLTSDYVIAALLKMRGYASSALELGHSLFAGELADILPVTGADLREAWRIFRQFQDKEWSFTDCTSKAIMDRLRIQKAFSFDRPSASSVL